MRALAITGIVTAALMPSIISGSDIRATPPSRRMSAGTRSSAITATAPASSAILASSGVTTSMITPPLSISARPRLTRMVPVSCVVDMPCSLRRRAPATARLFDAHVRPALPRQLHPGLTWRQLDRRAGQVGVRGDSLVRRLGPVAHDEHTVGEDPHVALADGVGLEDDAAARVDVAGVVIAAELDHHVARRDLLAGLVHVGGPPLPAQPRATGRVPAPVDRRAPGASTEEYVHPRHGLRARRRRLGGRPGLEQGGRGHAVAWREC